MRRLALLLFCVALGACAGRSPRAGAEFRDCPTCPAMMVIAPGKFRMGGEGGEPGRPEGPVREVRIGYAFALGRHEVTQAQFAAFVADTGYAMRGGCQVWKDGWATPLGASWVDPGYGRLPFDDEPVTCVSWVDARAYVGWLAQRTGAPYRLPTEAEWEFAARAGTSGGFFWSGIGGADDMASACEYANVYDRAGVAGNGFGWAAFDCDDGFARAAPVGSFRPNAFGLYDMIGNVWEWTADCYRAPYPAQPVDGSAVEADGPCARRTVRGGSWITRPDRQRVSFRGRDPETTLFSFFGFRVARDLTP
ncbi:MAG: formylglycine-generating enzyme family protein [Gammaproteobacteria bacterium]|nr:formylglycine-generating enzyme family protein [Gammaproteobacteria bacterium]